MDLGQLCHLIICNEKLVKGTILKKSILQLKLELEFHGKLKISSLDQYIYDGNKQRFEDLEKIIQINEDCHTFVDEFVLKNFNDPWDESALAQVKKSVPSLWIIVGGVRYADKTDFTPENFKKVFGSNFFTPVMKYPLR